MPNPFKTSKLSIDFLADTGLEEEELLLLETGMRKSVSLMKSDAGLAFLLAYLLKVDKIKFVLQDDASVARIRHWLVPLAFTEECFMAEKGLIDAKTPYASWAPGPNHIEFGGGDEPADLVVTETSGYFRVTHA